jgi:hypothetical protein
MRSVRKSHCDAPAGAKVGPLQRAHRWFQRVGGQQIPEGGSSFWKPLVQISARNLAGLRRVCGQPGGRPDMFGLR